MARSSAGKKPAKKPAKKAAGNATKKKPAAVADRPQAEAADDGQRWAAWSRYADTVLQRAALIARLARGSAPDDFAGLRISDADLDRLLAELTDLPADPKAVDKARAELDPMLETATADFHASLEVVTPFSMLAANAGVAREEAEVLAVLCAVELDARRERLVAYLQDDVTKKRLTLGGLRQLFGNEHPGALTVAPDTALRRAGVVHVAEDGPWANREVAVASTVTWALMGDASDDPDLPGQAAFVDAVDADASGDPLVLAVGDDRQRRLALAYNSVAGNRFLVSPMPASDKEWDAVVREATLRGIGVIVEAQEALSDEARHRIDRADHLAWGITSPLELPLAELPRRRWKELLADNSKPDADEWAAVFGVDTEPSHALTAEQLQLVGHAYAGVDHDLDAAVRRLASGKIDRLTTRIRPQRTWDDLVLESSRLTQLQELVARYRHRDHVHGVWGFSPHPSIGIVAIFHGSSGTGKTLAAEIIAGDLGLDLFKLDVSSVVSKYIGETEKNLEEVFSAAEASSGVLLFDEADALFGKRSEVSDARDRYANVEVSYLLQRVERYDGIVILTSNLQKNIDTAFLRRIDVSVEFDMPEEDERRSIWKFGFASKAPMGDVDIDFLARQFKLSGGSIRNVALYSAFLAAADGGAITMDHVVLALKREYQKLGKLITVEEFGDYFAQVTS